MRTILAALLSTMVLAGCGTSNGLEPQLLANGEAVTSGGADLYEKGKQSLLTGNYGIAAGQLRAALRDNPVSLDALNALALTYERLGRHDVSQRYFAQALAVDPGSVQTLNNIARSLLDRGSVGGAISYLKRAQALDPQNPVVRANLADVTRREASDTKARLASVSRDTTPATVWIERTSASKQTLVTRADLHGPDGASERDVPLHLVNFSTVGLKDMPAAEPAVSASAEVQVAPTEPAASRPKVVVANGNGRTGMAARMRSYLEGRGWKIVGLMNADQFNYGMTTIVYRAEHEAEARRLAALLPVKAGLVKQDDLTADVVLRIGIDLLPFDSGMDA